MKKDKLELYKSICKNWEDNTKFDLEHSLVKKVIRKSCNDYIMIFENGEIKQKGETFKTEIELGKGFYQPIVKKAIVEYFVNGTKPEDTLKNCNDILDFCMYEKSGKDFTIMHGDEVVQRTNRFYCSNKGKFLHKTRTYYNHKLLKQVTDDINIKNERVVILNNYDSKKKIEEYDINYKYYLTQIYTSIYELLNSTNTLF